MKFYMLAAIALGMMGCVPSSTEIPVASVTIQEVQVSRGEKVWLVQSQPGENDKVILCQAKKYPVCSQVWDGFRSTFQENTLPENPYK